MPDEREWVGDILDLEPGAVEVGEDVGRLLREAEIGSGRRRESRRRQQAQQAAASTATSRSLFMACILSRRADGALAALPAASASFSAVP